MEGGNAWGGSVPGPLTPASWKAQHLSHLESEDLRVSEFGAWGVCPSPQRPSASFCPVLRPTQRLWDVPIQALFGPKEAHYRTWGAVDSVVRIAAAAAASLRGHNPLTVLLPHRVSEAARVSRALASSAEQTATDTRSSSAPRGHPELGKG